MKRIAAIAVLMLTISGCQTTDYTGDENSTRYRIPVGSTLTLNQALTIPADYASIYLFRGKVSTYRNVDIYYPHCQFWLDKVGKQVRTISPDTFVITKINDWEDYTFRKTLHFADARLFGSAGFSGGLSVGVGGDGGPSIIKYATILSLRSDSQPEVKEIVCSHWGDRGDVEAVTIKETRDALGSVFTLGLKTQ
ncbi:MAG: hypothetical protein ACC641_10260 [Acidiferrobacterales bacterium]